MGLLVGANLAIPVLETVDQILLGLGQLTGLGRILIARARRDLIRGYPFGTAETLLAECDAVALIARAFRCRSARRASIGSRSDRLCDIIAELTGNDGGSADTRGAPLEGQTPDNGAIGRSTRDLERGAG